MGAAPGGLKRQVAAEAGPCFALLPAIWAQEAGHRSIRKITPSRQGGGATAGAGGFHWTVQPVAATNGRDGLDVGVRAPT